ncbi:alkaline phosphatase family protein [Bradyrhizobium diazoefficiens]|nr:alkaline phosphatase family protein [Bradyrhizobium diazoefficiens]WLA69240.1 alkaline phosphatase family protein [Bradyrhizobium diazoefficiens]
MLDGLRPDQLDEAVTPNLAELSKIGLRLARHTSSFPSETRVSSAALSTGGHSRKDCSASSRAEALLLSNIQHLICSPLKPG